MCNYSFKQDAHSIIFVLNDLNHNPNLTDWEKEFIKSLRKHYIADDKFLSKKQLQKLSDIWEKY